MLANLCIIICWSEERTHVCSQWSWNESQVALSVISATSEEELSSVAKKLAIGNSILTKIGTDWDLYQQIFQHF